MVFYKGRLKRPVEGLVQMRTTADGGKGEKEIADVYNLVFSVSLF